MQDLIKATYQHDRPTVSARELHEFLETDTPFRLWFPRMAEYGFIEGVDYTPYIFVHPQNHQEITDYEITFEMGKEIAMLQRTEKGKQARTYFIQIEKAWNTPEMVMSRALKMANTQIEKLVANNSALHTQIADMKPKAIFADAVASSSTSILVGELAKLIKQNGVDIGQQRLFEWLRNNGYLIKSGTSRNMPTQYSMELGLFEIKETTIANPDGSIRITRTPKVTGKGQAYFVNKFLAS